MKPIFSDRQKRFGYCVLVFASPVLFPIAVVLLPFELFGASIFLYLARMSSIHRILLLPVDEGECRTVGRAFAFRTPFWSDPSDFSEDSDVQWLIRRNRIEPQLSKLRKLRIRVNCVYFILASVTWYLRLQTDPSQEHTRFQILSAVFLYLIFFWIISFIFWSTRRLRKINANAKLNAQSGIHQRSRSRYERWKNELRETDREEFFRVLNWEQNQQIVKYQREAAFEARQASEFARQAANSARQTEINTRKF